MTTIYVLLAATAIGQGMGPCPPGMSGMSASSMGTSGMTSMGTSGMGTSGMGTSGMTGMGMGMNSGGSWGQIAQQQQLQQLQQQQLMLMQQQLEQQQSQAAASAAATSGTTATVATTTRPAEILSASAQSQLKLSAKQRRRLAEMQKKVDNLLDEMLTIDQKEQVATMAAGKSSRAAAIAAAVPE
ncbi:hypothetical protein [Paludisphaera rhizosphaerae]|uniref:hypothetical protein n=1 Tax=Paludisphaera rhizosphaerae TaxID=2711216 RepID=UPI0019818572|nr:hypothetical protein [Paludisphaera rhizosphaerae]